MKKLFTLIPIIIIFLGISSCASYMDEYNDKDDSVSFYRGLKLQDVFISIENFSAEEIEFKK